MLLVLWRLDDVCFALDSAEIVEVLPLVATIEVVHQPAGIAGLLNRQGAPVPVIDLSALVLGRSALPRMSTRIILVGCPDQTGNSRLLGLIAEQATEMLHCDPRDLAPSQLAPRSFSEPCLTPRGLVQRIRLDRLVQLALPQ